MPTLTAAPISARDLEKKEQELIHEFLGAYFNGVAHADDDGNQVTFEDCAVEFNQCDVRSLGKPLIHWSFTSRNTRRQPGDGGILILDDTLSSVFIQTAAGGRDNEQDFLCRSVSDHFRELLESKAPLALAAKGIARLRLMRGPTPLTMPGLQTRLCIVAAHLEYLVRER